MKRTAMTRKAPMARGTSTLKAKSSLHGAVRATGKPRQKAMKSKQRPVTPEEKLMWDRLATEIGCVACMKDGQFNQHVSIHHVDGRTKPGCHKLVLPLCAPHHQQDDTDPAGRVAVHPNKSRFEKLYGTQEELMVLCFAILERNSNGNQAR
jgi:hypothetical protein